jgi:hypothetical protein
VRQQAGGTGDRAQVQRRRQAVPIPQLEATGGRQGDGGDLRHDVVDVSVVRRPSSLIKKKPTTLKRKVRDVNGE